jgi:hypothetical protein
VAYDSGIYSILLLTIFIASQKLAFNSRNIKSLLMT